MKNQTNLQLAPIKNKKTNGILNGKSSGVIDINSRTFETRLIPRYDEIPPLPEGLPQPTFSEASVKILQERYLLKGGNLEVVETISERFWHIAYDIASAGFDFGESRRKVFDKALTFYKIMVRQEFLPNSPTIMNAGKQNGLQYSACFVLPVEDDLSGIFDSIKHAALIHQTGGGTGFAFSRLRPSGSRVKTTGGVASGPVSFLRVFNAATESIKQGGTRRGANMGILRIDHPDVMEFIRSKSDLDDTFAPVFEEISPFLSDDSVKAHFKRLLLDRQISNFNISVAVTDKFMEAYFKGEDYDLVDPRTKEITGKLNAKEVFDEIIDRAWDCADPGLVFIDRINNSPANPMGKNGEIESTNPCGEQPLEPFDACNLGSINLGKFVLADGSDVDWEGLKEITHQATEFLDDVVQVNPYNLSQIYEKVHQVRRIGLGVMGWADMLFRLKIAYDNEKALVLAEKVMKFINEEGHKKSGELAKDRGVFPDWPTSIYADSADGLAFKDRPESSAFKTNQLLRNSTVTTIAPTGTISIIGDCSSGIEPVFALVFIHRAKGDGGKTGNEMRILTIANKSFTEIAKKQGFYSDDLAKKIMDQGSVKGLEEVPEDWQKVFTTAPEIAPEWHVKMQAAFQKYTDNGVSKTINLPNSATREDIMDAYLMSWKTGCNGITVYRDGSKTTQVLNVASTLDKKKKEEVLNQITDPREERPMVLRGRTYEIMTPVGKGYVTINRDGTDQPFEVFITIGKGGMHTMADAEAIGRLVSISLQVAKDNRVAIAKKIASQLRGIGGASHIGFGKDRVMSLADAVAKVLSEDMALSIAQEEKVEPETLPLELSSQGSTRDDIVTEGGPKANTQVDLCPECGNATFIREDGCEKCYSCGFSKC